MMRPTRRTCSFVAAVGLGLAALATTGRGVAAQAVAHVVAFRPVTPSTAARAEAKPGPADSLYRAAREAMVRGDAKTAILLFERVADRYPKTNYATAALYYRAFLQYRQYTPGSPVMLRAALSTLKRLESSYPDAPQKDDARRMHTRICGELAQLGDAACREEVVVAAREAVPQSTMPYSRHRTIVGPQAGTATAAPAAAGTFVMTLGTGDSAPQGGCPNDAAIDNAISALNNLWKADSTQAMSQTGALLGLKHPCFVRLRQQALIMLMQRPAPIMTLAPAVFDAARNDPDPGVRSLATVWLVNQQWDPQAAKFLQTIFGRPFRTK
jgi:hypothetical protein